MTTLKDLQRTVERVRLDRGFTTEPLELLSLLVEEVGEIASELKKTWSLNYSELVVTELGDEIADTFVLLSALASSFDIDLEQAVTRKFIEADSQRLWKTANDWT